VKLSIVIICLDDPDLPNTIKSIRNTAGNSPEVIVVNDHGFTGLYLSDVGNVKVINNSHRLGVGPSRHIGLLHAKGDYVLLLDSHMRFQPGWYEKVMARLEGRPKTLTCFTCLALDSQHMDVISPRSKYYGATFNVFGPDRGDGSKMQVMEAVWNRGEVEDDYELPCVMGAAYAAPREWFLKISGLRFLRGLREDETVLSLRSWMFGGDVRIMTSVGIGHIFLLEGQKQPFTIPPGYTLHNKLLVLYTLLPDDLRGFLIEKLQLTQGGGELSTAKRMIEQNWHIIEVERAAVQTQSVRDFRWVAEKFQIQIPNEKQL
jgi:glycosyltransferase involved in cell wall biosynthesis